MMNQLGMGRNDNGQLSNGGGSRLGGLPSNSAFDRKSSEGHISENLIDEQDESMLDIDKEVGLMSPSPSNRSNKSRMSRHSTALRRTETIRSNLED